MYPKLPPGTDTKLSNPADIEVTHEPWIRQQLWATAVGIGITHEQLTGDLSSVNFASMGGAFGAPEALREAPVTHDQLPGADRSFGGRWIWWWRSSSAQRLQRCPAKSLSRKSERARFFTAKVKRGVFPPLPSLAPE